MIESLIAVHRLAKRRGRTAGNWVILGLVISAPLAILLLLCSRDRAKEAREAELLAALAALRRPAAGAGGPGAIAQAYAQHEAQCPACLHYYTYRGAMAPGCPQCIAAK